MFEEKDILPRIMIDPQRQLQSILQEFHECIFLNYYEEGKTVNTLVDFHSFTTSIDNIPIDIEVVIAGSYGLNYIYNKNKIHELNKKHRNFFDMSIEMNNNFNIILKNDNPIVVLAKPVESFWFQARCQNIESLFRSHDFDIHAVIKDEKGINFNKNLDEIKARFEFSSNDLKQKLENCMAVHLYEPKLITSTQTDVSSHHTPIKTYKGGVPKKRSLNLLDKTLKNLGYQLVYDKVGNIIRKSSIISFAKDDGSITNLFYQYFYRIKNIETEETIDINICDYVLERDPKVHTSADYQCEIKTDLNLTLKVRYRDRSNYILVSNIDQLLKNNLLLIRKPKYKKKVTAIFRLLLILNLIQNHEYLSLVSKTFIKNNKKLILGTLLRVEDFIEDFSSKDEGLKKLFDSLSFSIAPNFTYGMSSYSFDIDIYKCLESHETLGKLEDETFESFIIDTATMITNDSGIIKGSQVFCVSQHVSHNNFYESLNLEKQNVIESYLWADYENINYNMALSQYNLKSSREVQLMLEIFHRDINNSIFDSSYFIVYSNRPYQFFNSNKNYSFDMFNKGDVFIYPYMISTTYDMDFFEKNFEKDFGTSLILLVKKNSQYLNCFKFAMVENEKEILLPPGKITFVDKYVTEKIHMDNSVQYRNFVFGIYENCDNMPTTSKELNDFLTSYKNGLIIREPTKSLKTITINTGLCTDVPNDLVKYNLNPFQNIFCQDSTEQKDCYVLNLNDVYLYSGRGKGFTLQDNMFFSEYNTAWYYSYVNGKNNGTEQHLYTYHLNNLNLIDLFHPSNLKRIKSYYEKAPFEHQNILGSYFKINRTVTTDRSDKDISSMEYYRNGESIEIVYNNVLYNNKDGYSKQSYSTKEDLVMFQVLKTYIFTDIKLDGFICRASLSIYHLGHVFSDEILITDCIQLEKENRIKLVENEFHHDINSEDEVDQRVLMGFISLYSQRKKVNRLYDYFYTDGVFDRLLNYNEYWVYRFFTQFHNLIMTTRDRSIKEKYIELKKKYTLMKQYGLGLKKSEKYTGHSIL